MYKEIPRRTFSINISSLIQTVLSVLEFHQISHRKRFLTTGRGLLPPVGTFTRPRRTYSILVTVYANLACPVKSHLQMSNELRIIRNGKEFEMNRKGQSMLWI